MWGWGCKVSGALACRGLRVLELWVFVAAGC